MPKTVVVETLGGPDVMKIVDLDPGAPGRDEIRIRQKAIGVNFADIHYRRGTAPPHAMAKLPIPFTPGLEGVGVVEAVGADIKEFKGNKRPSHITMHNHVAPKRFTELVFEELDTSVTPPANRFDYSFLAPCPSSGLFVHGDQDRVAPLKEVMALIEKLKTQKGIVIEQKVVQGANHFFDGKIDALMTSVTAYLDKRLSTDRPRKD